MIAMNMSNEYAPGFEEKFVNQSFVTAEVVEDLTERAFCAVHQQSMTSEQHVKCRGVSEISRFHTLCSEEQNLRFILIVIGPEINLSWILSLSDELLEFWVFSENFVKFGLDLGSESLLRRVQRFKRGRRVKFLTFDWI